MARVLSKCSFFVVAELRADRPCQFQLLSVREWNWLGVRSGKMELSACRAHRSEVALAPKFLKMHSLRSSPVPAWVSKSHALPYCTANAQHKPNEQFAPEGAAGGCPSEARERSRRVPAPWPPTNPNPTVPSSWSYLPGSCAGSCAGSCGYLNCAAQLKGIPQ